MTDLGIKSINSVVWVDDDGQKYKRIFADGEIKDIPVDD